MKLYEFPIKISLKFSPKGPINNIAALVQIMASRRSGGKPLSEPMMVRLPTHICVARPQWVNKAKQTSASMISNISFFTQNYDSLKKSPQSHCTWYKNKIKITIFFF